MASAPNQVWLADITYVPTGEGWLYLAAVLDLATRKVVGWAMRDHMRTELTTAALDHGHPAAAPGPVSSIIPIAAANTPPGEYRKQLTA